MVFACALPREGVISTHIYIIFERYQPIIIFIKIIVFTSSIVISRVALFTIHLNYQQSIVPYSFDGLYSCLF